MGVLRKGYVQVYTGNGKGKTTAAFGLALRASGAGLKVYIQQFVKKKDSGEITALRNIDNIVVGRCGRGPFIIGKAQAADIKLANAGLAKAKKKILSGKYDLVILDEINIALKLGLVKCDEVLDIIKCRSASVELVLTGRNCPKKIKNAADLITDMREVRHPYRSGVIARRGIEY